MDIEKIRNEALTEDYKMETIADYLDGGEGSFGLHEVLTNGDTAVDRTAKLEAADNAHNFTELSTTQVTTQKEYADGAAIAQITSDGKISLDYDPEQGNPTFLSIEVNEGTPRVLMSDDMKAAFRTALGI